MSVSNYLRTVLPVGRIVLLLVMFAAVEHRVDQEDASCTYSWCERWWLSAQGRIWFNKLNPFPGPEDYLDAYSVDWGGTLESG